uniref:cytochrome c oxidase subunit III n=1 Tax=Haltichella nipponensis TaxID=2907788 RepID=UPI001EDE4464|nr:cytochrome c oxidase subunit III [Haltichella nipponensis]UIB40561.1 cytochrome c oxidase subunit III [Haltichella nipponensis]
MMKMFQPFHLVTLSPWPILMSFNIMNMFISILNWFNKNGFYFILFNLISLSICVMLWWRDVIREGTYQGFHTKKVYNGLKLGMILFIISEVFFFFSIFWCYFHMMLSPSIELGMLWPPKNIELFNPYSIPLLNTLILLSSGVTVTYTHYLIINKFNLKSYYYLMITVILGLIFSLFQLYEYYWAPFSMSDSVFGSIFFMSTGFHGLHVLIGDLFLMINLFRIYNNNFSSNHHFGFEAAAWYWHFVDIVWLFLYFFIYYWIFI